MIGIRADANEIVATGHIMRCITIAKQLKKMGQEILFFISDEYPIEMLEEENMEYVCLQSNWNDLLRELSILKIEIKKRSVSTLLVDSYQANSEYLSQLSTLCKVAYIDDEYRDIYPVNMIINYNGYALQFPYEISYGKDTRLLLGPSYVPLNEQFTKKYLKANRHNKVLLSSGGGDRYEAMLGILKEAEKLDIFKCYEFQVVVGRFYESEEVLEKFAAEHNNVHIQKNVKNMAQLMNECDFAISAAGTMLYELCATQTPTIFFVTADNQQYDKDFFEKERAMIFAGDLRKNRDEVLEKICEEWSNLTQNNELQYLMKRKLASVTDGNGAARIAQNLIELHQNVE